jgi:hypothetical protein
LAISIGIAAPKLRREFDAPLRPGNDRIVRGNIERFARRFSQMNDVASGSK